MGDWLLQLRIAFETEADLFKLKLEFLLLLATYVLLMFLICLVGWCCYLIKSIAFCADFR